MVSSQPSGYLRWWRRNCSLKNGDTTQSTFQTSAKLRRGARGAPNGGRQPAFCRLSRTERRIATLYASQLDILLRQVVYGLSWDEDASSKTYGGNRSWFHMLPNHMVADAEQEWGLFKTHCPRLRFFPVSDYWFGDNRVRSYPGWFLPDRIVLDRSNSLRNSVANLSRGTSRSPTLNLISTLNIIAPPRFRLDRRILRQRADAYTNGSSVEIHT